MKLSFQLGLDTSPVTFDNVRLVKKVGGSPSTIDRQKKNNVQLFPNPASEELTVSFTGGTLPEEIMLFDLFGKRVKSFTVSEGTNGFLIDISNLRSGIYIVRILG